MELRDLRYFEALASELNFGRAATALHLTQPALSLAVARLEKELGCALFQRTHQGVSLTAAGSVLLAETQGLHFSLERACTLARRASSGDVGSLAIGFLDSAVFDILPSAISAFLSAYPTVDLTLRQRSSSELITWVENDRLDVAFVRPQIPSVGIEMKVLLREEVVLAVSRDHPLAGQSESRLADLTEEKFVFPDRDFAPSIYAQWMEVCAEALFVPEIVAYVGSAQVMEELIAQNIGIGFAERSWLRRDDRVVALRLSDVRMELAIALAYKSDRISNTCRHFVDLVLGQSQDPSHRGNGPTLADGSAGISGDVRARGTARAEDAIGGVAVGGAEE